MNDLTVVDASALAALSGELGVKAQKSSSVRIPVLKINRAVEDENGKELPRGKIFLTGDKPAYADSVTFRPLSHHFQYSRYDAQSKRFDCWTRQIGDWSEELRDTKGTIRCGRPDGKAMRNMTRDQKQRFKDVKLSRLVRGLVSFTGTTVDGEEVTYENQPCMLKLTGQNNYQSGSGDKPYAPFEAQVRDHVPTGYELWNYELTLTTKKHRNDDGSVIWYTFEYAFDPKDPKQVTKEIYDSIISVRDIVREENAKVDAAYMAAIRGERDLDGVYSALGDDLDDDLADED